MPLVPVFIMGASIGSNVPFWDQQDEFGDTTLLVVKPDKDVLWQKRLRKTRWS
jgi:hypothetical protein